MIRYKVYQNKSQTSPTRGMWYARAVTEEMIDVDKLAEHMSRHNTPFSKGTIKGILVDAVNCIKELILDGKSVKINDLAIFSGGIITKPAKTIDEFSAAENIKGYRLRSRATGELRPAVFKSEASVREFTKYEPAVSQPAPTPVSPVAGDAPTTV